MSSYEKNLTMATCTLSLIQYRAEVKSKPATFPANACPLNLGVYTGGGGLCRAEVLITVPSDPISHLVCTCSSNINTA